MMVVGRVLGLSTLLVVLIPRGVSTFSSRPGQPSYFPPKAISPPAKHSVDPPSKSYSDTPSHPSHLIPTPVKQYVAPPSQPVYPRYDAPPSQPLYPGYGASSPVYGQPSSVVVPVGYPVYVSPPDSPVSDAPAKPHPAKKEEEAKEEEEEEEEELQCDKTVPIFLPREMFTPQNTDSSCNFDDFDDVDGVDDGLCSWTQDGMDDFDWTVIIGATPSDDTGPSADHTTGTGAYAFIEASSPRTHGDAAQLVSPMLDGSAKCLTFWYHRYGSGLGDLTVYIRTDSEDDFPALTIPSSSVDAWRQATLSLPSATSSAVPYQIVIEATVGSSSKSDIAIDDISFAAGLCGAEPEPPFFVALNNRLKAEHCNKKSATRCTRFGEDGPFQAIADYVWNFCKRDFSSPAYLEDLILNYCKYHSDDDAVKKAYQCSTGCKLADHINQVCHNMKLVPDCPDDDFDLINGRCYRLFKDATNDRVDWEIAAVRCQAMGALLARLETEEESDALNDLLLNAGGKVWIGATDFITEGEFNWLGSTVNIMNPLFFTDWETNEPSGNGDCVVFWPNRDGWEDEPCSNHQRFICEKSPTFILDHPGAAATP